MAASLFSGTFLRILKRHILVKNILRVFILFFGRPSKAIHTGFVFILCLSKNTVKFLSIYL